MTRTKTAPKTTMLAYALLLAGAALVCATLRGRPSGAPDSAEADSFEELLAAAQAAGYEVHPCSDQDGRGAVLVNRAANPAARPFAGGFQPGVLYTAMAPDERTADERAWLRRAVVPCRHAGRVYYEGDLDLLRALRHSR